MIMPSRYVSQMRAFLLIVRVCLRLASTRGERYCGGRRGDAVPACCLLTLGSITYIIVDRLALHAELVRYCTEYYPLAACAVYAAKEEAKLVLTLAISATIYKPYHYQCDRARKEIT